MGVVLVVAGAAAGACPFWRDLIASSSSDLRILPVPLIPSWEATAWSWGRRSVERSASPDDAGAALVTSVVSVTKGFPSSIAI